MNQIINLILALAVCALLIAIGSYFGYQSGYMDAVEEYIEDQECKQIKP